MVLVQGIEEDLPEGNQPGVPRGTLREIQRALAREQKLLDIAIEICEVLGLQMLKPKTVRNIRRQCEDNEYSLTAAVQYLRQHDVDLQNEAKVQRQEEIEE